MNAKDLKRRLKKAREFKFPFAGFVLTIRRPTELQMYEINLIGNDIGAATLAIAGRLPNLRVRVT